MEELQQAYQWALRRFGLPDRWNALGAQHAVELAQQLARSPLEQPAAVFYAIVRHIKAFGPAGRVLAVMCAINLCQRQGRPLQTTEPELFRLFLPIQSQTLSYLDVCAWFDAHRTE